MSRSVVAEIVVSWHDGLAVASTGKMLTLTPIGDEGKAWFIGLRDADEVLAGVLVSQAAVLRRLEDAFRSAADAAQRIVRCSRCGTTVDVDDELNLCGTCDEAEYDAMSRAERQAEEYAAEAVMGMRAGTTQGWYDEPEPPDPYEDALLDAEFESRFENDLGGEA